MFRGTSDKHGLAGALITRTSILAAKVDHPGAALPLDEEALHLLVNSGYSSQAKQVEKMIENIRVLIQAGNKK